MFLVINKIYVEINMNKVLNINFYSLQILNLSF